MSSAASRLPPPTGDLDRVFKGSHIGSRLIHQINQMDVSLELDTVYRLISSPGFVSQDSILPPGPQIITDLHQALVDNAFFPCPEPPPEIVADAVDEDDENSDGGADDDDLDDCGAGEGGEDEPEEYKEDSETFLETGNQKPETISKLEALRLLRRHFPDLDLTVADLPPWQKKIRKTSAKLARNYREKPRFLSQTYL